jgi:hypothetical protein
LGPFCFRDLSFERAAEAFAPRPLRSVHGAFVDPLLNFRAEHLKAHPFMSFVQVAVSRAISFRPGRAV